MRTITHNEDREFNDSRTQNTHTITFADTSETNSHSQTWWRMLQPQFVISVFSWSYSRCMRTIYYCGDYLWNSVTSYLHGEIRSSSSEYVELNDLSGLGHTNISDDGDTIQERRSTTDNNHLQTITIIPTSEQCTLKDNRLSPSIPARERIFGSLFGLAIGDALGAAVEFKPNEYLLKYPVTDFLAGGTWGLEKGQFTDDTSMALCLAASLVECGEFNGYDQIDRYRKWYRDGYMSSTGSCFDIGASTREAIETFESRKKQFSDSDNNTFLWHCGSETAAGNGSLMRLAPVALFFYRNPKAAVYYCGQSSLSTHSDRRAYDACRFFGALIVGALQGMTKAQLLDEKFYEMRPDWFNNEELVDDIQTIMKGSYREKGPGIDGIRGSGFVLSSLEAVLWAFLNDGNSFREGVLAAVNLGEDTDTTAAIYGQLAGAYYGFNNIPNQWREYIHSKELIAKMSDDIFRRGNEWYSNAH